MNYLNREEAIEQAGIKAVEAAEALNCEPTNRVTDDGTMEFSASVEIDIDEGTRLVAYYYQDEVEAMETEDLSNLEWAVHGYRII